MFIQMHNWNSKYTKKLFLFLFFFIDTDGFVIPSLEIEDTDQNKTDTPKVEDTKLIEVEVVEKAT